jgi:hypothetical protein
VQSSEGISDQRFLGFAFEEQNQIQGTSHWHPQVKLQWQRPTTSHWHPQAKKAQWQKPTTSWWHSQVKLSGRGLHTNGFEL